MSRLFNTVPARWIHGLSMHAKGSFEVVMSPEPPYDQSDGLILSRASIDKQFSGALVARSKVHMLSALTSVEGSGAYVAIERVSGTLDGKSGSFVLCHRGLGKRGERTLEVSVVPDSGSGELKGISGRMDIQIVDGNHFYEFEYEIEGQA